MASSLKHWDVEDKAFWESTGKKIANRNLWISIPNLFLGFAIWIYWGMVAKYIQQLHLYNTELFNFTFMNDEKPYYAVTPTGEIGSEDAYRALMYLLPAVAGLSGATMRVAHSFMVSISGGRNVKFMTTLLLIIPALGAGIALQSSDTPFWIFVILATLSGIGGGAFASSMSNISFFFPKRMQGLALGLNAGIGNLGVSAMQFLIPWIITFGAFGGLGGEPYDYMQSDGSIGQMWIQNAGLVWVPILAATSLLAFLFMHNLPFHKCGPTPVAVGKYLWLSVLALVGAAAGVVLLLIPWGDFPELLKTVLIVLVAVPVTLALMRFLTPKETKDNLKGQFGIFKMKHNWVMTYLYTMTFGSFIGYASAFPKLIDDVFGVYRVGEHVGEPTGMSSAAFIWIGAGVGALIRPVGGWLADKFGGARVTQWDTIVMIAATVGAGYYVSLAMKSEEPQQFFVPFLLLFILLFATTGIGNGSTFRMIGVIFTKDVRGPVLGFTSAIAAYGAYLIPMFFADQIKEDTPQYALYGFAFYYATCLIMNWWFYARKNAEIKC